MGGAIPELVVLVSLRKQVEQVMGGRPVSIASTVSASAAVTLPKTHSQGSADGITQGSSARQAVRNRIFLASYKCFCPFTDCCPWDVSFLRTVAPLSSLPLCSQCSACGPRLPRTTRYTVSCFLGRDEALAIAM